jgi:hypothetical protein
VVHEWSGNRVPEVPLSVEIEYALPVARDFFQASTSKSSVIRGVLFRGVLLQEQAVRVRKSLAMHEPVEDTVQRIGRLDVMEIPWKREDRGSFKYGFN